jgi:hypothetical protein
LPGRMHGWKTLDSLTADVSTWRLPVKEAGRLFQ